MRVAPIRGRRSSVGERKDMPGLLEVGRIDHLAIDLQNASPRVGREGIDDRVRACDILIGRRKGCVDRPDL